MIDGCLRENDAFGVVGTDAAPALGEVYEGRVAAGAFEYSDALRQAGGQWSRDRLLAYLTDPEAVAAGTYMPNPEIEDPAVRGAIVDVLQALKEEPE